MATGSTSHRAWRAACPNCGAPVEFRSAASVFAVCSFCKSTVLREGEALRRIGHSAELFDDHSPLQLGAAGTWQGAGFTLVGRLQLRYEGGTWNEWHALFDDGRTAWLSEDNGRYVLGADLPLAEPAPPAASLQVGTQQVIAGQPWFVASVTPVTLAAAEGELPRPPEAGAAWVVADLRNTRGEVGTLDYAAPQAPAWTVGRPVSLAELAMTGLAAGSAEKTLAARAAPCPSCGAALAVRLASTRSIVCSQCHAVVDVSKGVGGELAHFAQAGGGEPLLPLGATGVLALGDDGPLPWQVVGYVERDEIEDGAVQGRWSEYLLYHRSAGFAFLVDAEDGWSWVRPLTGVPQGSGASVRHAGDTYRRRYDDYVAEVSHVLGEFYWQVTRRQRTRNADYAGTGRASNKRLNREQALDGPEEVTWSGGETLAADTVFAAFGIDPNAAAAQARDAKPVSAGGGGLLAKLFLWLFALSLPFVFLRSCDDDRDAAYVRTGGGSYGGFSSGGSHK